MTIIATTTPEITQTLRRIVEDEPNTIRAYVAETALEFGGQSPSQMFTDVSTWGCESGVISDLVHYADTRSFFDRYYYEIELLREEVEENLGEPLRFNGDLKNWLAWFAFEETAYRMANDDLGLDL